MKITRINLDDYKTIETKTAGWTDAQIKNAKIEDLQKQIDGAEMVLVTLHNTLEEHRQRIANLNLILARKRQIGD